MDRRSRLVLTLIAVVCAVGLSACGGDDQAEGTAPETATSQPDTGTATEPTPAEARKALEDTSTRPVIPKPVGAAPRRLVIEDIVKGKGAPARRGSTVMIKVVGENFSNGNEFADSWDTGRSARVVIGKSKVIEGWTRGLVGIRRGGRRMLTVPPELGYGPSGHPPAVPPNETLIYVVDAVAIR